MSNSIHQSISVIIPTYNRSHTIKKCLDSVFNQTYKVNEIIVVDDCSTDNTIDILNSYEDQITVLQTEINSGAQVARNKGIKAANSNWIAFLDSDDEWLLDKIEKQISELQNSNFNYFTLVHGNCIVNNFAKKNKYIWTLDQIEGDNVYDQLLSKSGTLFPSIMTSKVALEKIGYLDESVISYQEWDTAIRLSKFCRFIHIQEPLFIYNIHDNSISRSSVNNINGYYFIIRKFKKEIKKYCGDRIYDDHILKCANMAMNSNKFKLGRKFLNGIKDNSIKKSLLFILSYLRVKPIYLFQSLKYLSWKN